MQASGTLSSQVEAAWRLYGMLGLIIDLTDKYNNEKDLHHRIHDLQRNITL